MNNKKTILYFYLSYSSFVEKDEQILATRYLIKKFHFASRRKILTPLQFYRQLFFLIFNIWKADLMISQSAGYLSFLPVLFSKLTRKPILIIAIGVDCDYLPSINYGHYRKFFLSIATKFSIKYATCVAPVHQSLVFTRYTYQPNDFKYQGFKAFVKNVEAQIKVIPNGYEYENWKRDDKIKRERKSFVTAIANINIHNIIILKGLDLFIEIARLFPENKFYLIGLPQHHPLGGNLNNLIKIPFVSHKELPTIFSKCEFYMQLSMMEGFPNTICEAMLCECIPIGSNVGAIPDIIGNTGFILKYKNIDKLKKIIEAALKSNREKLGKQARQRIINKFPIENRRKELLKLTEELIKS